MATAQSTNQFNSPFSVENIINSKSRQGAQKNSDSPQSDHEHSIPTPDVSSSISTSFGKWIYQIFFEIMEEYFYLENDKFFIENCYCW